MLVLEAASGEAGAAATHGRTATAHKRDKAVEWGEWIHCLPAAADASCARLAAAVADTADASASARPCPSGS